MHKPDPAIKKFLDSGEKTLRGEPIFRLSWSDECLETRIGIFNDFAGHIFIRTTSGAREVPKYPYIKSRWILEKWASGDRINNPFLPNAKDGSYEPFFVFESAENKYLQPTLKVVEFIVSLAQGDHRASTKAEAINLAERMEMQEIKDFMKVIDYEPSKNAEEDLEECIKNEISDQLIQ